MKDVEETGDSLTQKLNILERNVVYIFLQIKECKNKEEAQCWFEFLDRVQCGLCTLVYKHDIGISDRLHRFMSDLDNSEEAKEYYFEKIKNGEYTF